MWDFFKKYGGEAGMRKQHKLWQNEWRQIMGKPIDVDFEYDCDFDLHFDIWNLEKVDFFRLFKNFPRGLEIAEKAYRLKWEDLGELGVELNDEELVQQTKNAIELLQKICPSQHLSKPKIEFKEGDDKLRLELLNQGDSLSIKLDDEFSSFVKKSSGVKGYNAYFFLSEPLYRLNSSYIPRNWILWSLTGFQNLNPYTPLLKLEYNRCDVALTNEGVILYKLTE